jgi:molecular chaperone DnaK (HSP70)
LQASNSDKLYETLAIDGNKKLGGDDFDKAIFDIIVKHLNNKSGIDFATEETYVNSGLDDIEDYYCIRSILLEEAENAKLSLSEEDMCEISKANLFFYQGKYHNLELTISRDDFIKGMESNLTIIKQTIQRVFQNHTISKEEIDRVILVGGSCYIPAIRNIIKDFFGFEPYSDEDLSTLVVSGASLIANSDGIGIRINDIISHSLGIEVLAHNGKMELEKLLKKNDKYPCSNEKIFSTVSNNQEEVCINIWEGEIENDVNQNEFYGGFILDGIEKADAGVPKIKVKFDFDKSRILTVTAEDLSTKSKKEVIVKKGVHLSSVKAKPIDFTVLIDSSGSMRGREMELAKDACKKLVTNIIDLNTHKLALISFGDHAKIVSELTNNKEELIKRIETISSYGGTPMAEAFNLSNGILEISSNERISIVVTDGAPNNKQSVIKATNRAKQLAIRVIAIGVGSGVDSSYLKTITTSQNDYHYVDDMSSLEETFTSVINALQR